jgi:transposase
MLREVSEYVSSCQALFELSSSLNSSMVRRNNKKRGEDFLTRSAAFSLKETNQEKRRLLQFFLTQYGNALRFYVDLLWNNPLEWHTKNKDKVIVKTHVLDVSQGLYDCPSMLANLASYEFDSVLSARALKCAATQACGIVNAVLKKRIKDEALLEYKKAHGYEDERLERRLQKAPTKPSLKDFRAELNSLVAEISEGNNSFDLWVEFSALFERKEGERCSPHILVPLKHHKQSLKHEAEGKRLNSVLLYQNEIQFRYEHLKPSLKSEGEVIGVDQGMKSLLTTSRNDNLAEDKHGWTLLKILQKMSRQKSGSEGFQRSQAHLRNHINFIMKRLDLSEVKEVKLEEIINIKFGVSVTRLMKHWSNPLIRDSLLKVCEESGVLLTFVPNEYNSQRCNHCGWTQKANRKGKEFCCKKCQHRDDADHNASLNILEREFLPDLPDGFRICKHNLKGFYWNFGLLVAESGEDLTVPPTATKLDLVNIC